MPSGILLHGFDVPMQAGLPTGRRATVADLARLGLADRTGDVFHGLHTGCLETILAQTERIESEPNTVVQVQGRHSDDLYILGGTTRVLILHDRWAKGADPEVHPVVAIKRAGDTFGETEAALAPVEIDPGRYGVSSREARGTAVVVRGGPLLRVSNAAKLVADPRAAAWCLNLLRRVSLELWETRYRQELATQPSDRTIDILQHASILMPTREMSGPMPIHPKTGRPMFEPGDGQTPLEFVPKLTAQRLGKLAGVQRETVRLVAAHHCPDLVGFVPHTHGILISQAFLAQSLARLETPVQRKTRT